MTTFVGFTSTTVQSSNAPWVQLNEHASTQVGDLLVAFLFTGKSGTYYFTTPAGWTREGDVTPGANVVVTAFSRIKQSGDSNQHMFEVTQPQGAISPYPRAVLMTYRGVDAADPVAGFVNGGIAADGVNPVTIPGAAAARTIDLALMVAWTDHHMTSWTPSDGAYLERIDSASNVANNDGGTILVLERKATDATGGTSATRASSVREAARFSVILRRSNAAPGAPGAFTSPTSGERVTTTDAVQWGAATDPDGDTLTYQAELSLNGGSTWTRYHDGPGDLASFDYSGLAATTSAIWRARAVDVLGAVSGWTNSPTFTINKPPGQPGAFVSPTGTTTVDTLGDVEAGAASDTDGNSLTYEWDLSTDNGATWTRKRNLTAGLAWQYDYSADAATTAAKWRLRAHDGAAYGPFRESSAFTIYHNSAPLTPTPTEPVGGATKDRNGVITLRATFNDPDLPNDSVSKNEWRWRDVTLALWTTASQTNNLRSYDIPAGTLAAADYEWQARYTDSAGATGPYSASEFFTAANPPAGPVITDPTDGEAVGPTGVLAWSSADQAAYRVRRVADLAGSPDTATVLYDSGVVESATARNHPLTYDTNDLWQHLQVQTRDAGGLYSVWTSVRVEASWTPPAAPSVELFSDSTTASIRARITNPTPATGEPTVVAHELWRRETLAGGEGIRIATDITPGGSFRDYTPASDLDYEYQAVSVADNNTRSSSDWTGAAVVVVTATSSYGGY